MARKKSSKHKNSTDSEASDNSDVPKKKSHERGSRSSSSTKPVRRTSPRHSRSASPRKKRTEERSSKGSRDSSRSKHQAGDKVDSARGSHSRDRQDNSQGATGSRRDRDERSRRESDNKGRTEKPRRSQERERGGKRPQSSNNREASERKDDERPERREKNKDYSNRSRTSGDRDVLRQEKSKKGISEKDKDKYDNKSEDHLNQKKSKDKQSSREKDRKHHSDSDSSSSFDCDSDSSSENEKKSPTKDIKSRMDSERVCKGDQDESADSRLVRKSSSWADSKEKNRHRGSHEKHISQKSRSSSSEHEDKETKRKPQHKDSESRNSKKRRGTEKREEGEESENEKHGGTPEKEQKLSGKRTFDREDDRHSVDNSDQEKDDDEEEKEEGEISEEEEDVSRRPLIAMSEGMSEISTDEDDINTKDDAQDISKRLAASAESGDQKSKPALEIPSKSSTAKQPKQKEGGESQKTKDESEKDVDSSGLVTNAISKAKERPVLESESDSDEDASRVVKSRIESKRTMGSSVSVVSKRQDQTHRRSRSRSQERKRREDRREPRSSPRPRQSYKDRERRDRDGGSDRKRPRDDETKSEDPESKATKETTAKEEEKKDKKATAIDIITRTGGAYIPPAKLRMLQAQITDKTSEAYQRMSWEALKKSINGLINKVNVSNIIEIIKELFQENIVRGRGLLARSVMQAQAASPTFTHVYAALVAVINTKFPQNGELILKRLVLTFRQGFRRNDKGMCLSSTRFIAHLINQQVAHEVLALEILTLLLESPTDDSVEVAIGFLKESGQKLTEISSRAINSIFERLRNVLHEGQLDTRVQYMIEVMFAIRKDGFKDHIALMTDLDLVEEEEQFTHLLQLEDAVNGEAILNIFKADPNFIENEEKYKSLKREILEEGSSDEGSGGSSGSESSSSENEDEEEGEKKQIIDQTETNLVALRRTIYLTVQSSLDHNECAHKMMKRGVKEGQENEVCNMILDCCAQLRTYEKFFGLLAQRFCQIDKKYVEPFQQIFQEQYETIHRLETNKIRNVAKLFAHLLFTDAISWGVLSIVKLTEADTTSASRIFLKILFQELSEYMGILKLNDRLKDVTLQPYFEGVMPRQNHNDTRFAINFFTTIGLGGLTDDLREHLKSYAKQMVQKKQEEEAKALQKANAEAEKDSSSSEESDSSSSDSKSSSSESEDSSPRRKKKKKKKASSHKSRTSEKDKGKKRESDSKKARKTKKDSAKSQDLAAQGKTIADRLLDMAQYGKVRNGKGHESRMNSRDSRNDRDSGHGRELTPQRDRSEDRGGRGNEDRLRHDSVDHDLRVNESTYSGGREERRKDQRTSENEYRGRNAQNFQQDRERWPGRNMGERNWINQGRIQRGRNERDGRGPRNEREDREPWNGREDRGPRTDGRWRGDEMRRQGDGGWRNRNNDRGYDNRNGRWREEDGAGWDRVARGGGEEMNRFRHGEGDDPRYDFRRSKENIQSFDRENIRGSKRGRSGEYQSQSDNERQPKVKKGQRETESRMEETLRNHTVKKKHISGQTSSDDESDDDNEPIKKKRKGKKETSSKKTSKKRKSSLSSSHSSGDSSSSEAPSSPSSSSSSSSEEDGIQEKRIIKRKVSDQGNRQQSSGDMKKGREEDVYRNRRRK